MSNAPSAQRTAATGEAAPRMSLQVRRALFVGAAALCLALLFTPYAAEAAPLALLLGLVMAQITGIPFPAFFKDYKVTPRLLQYSVVGLGFGMSVKSAIAAGKQGVLFTLTSIVVTLALGALLGKLLKLDKKTTHLISSGTAICGGSAIAAVAPVIKADEKQISVALGIVFILNAIALFIFPWIGHRIGMSPEKFGLWCAIAIHDTSSVVGAATQYGEKAAEIATVVKLARALWIIPLALCTAFIFRDGQQKIKIPYFIGFFILAMLVNTYLLTDYPSVSKVLVQIAKAGLVLTLFFIGAGLSLKNIRAVGPRPLILGLVLWIVIAVGSLLFILHQGA